MKPAPGATLGSFRITAELGACWRGEVWRTEDTEHGREVASGVYLYKLSFESHSETRQMVLVR